MVYLIALGLGYVMEDAGYHPGFGQFLQVAAIVCGVVWAVLVIVSLLNSR